MPEIEPKTYEVRLTNVQVSLAKRLVSKYISEQANLCGNDEWFVIEKHLKSQIEMRDKFQKVLTDIGKELYAHEAALTIKTV